MLTSARTPLATSHENVTNVRGSSRLLRSRHHHATTIDPTQVSKTPAAAAADLTSTKKTKSRRALGDISNRKPSHNNAGAATTTKPGAGVVGEKDAATKPIGFVVAASKQPPVVAAVAKAVSFAMDVDNDMGELSHVRRSVAPKTPHTSKLHKSGHLNNLHQQQQREIEFDFDEDVEMPAGRLWVDQKWLDDDDDQASVELSLEGADTAREDLMEAMAHRHRVRLEMADTAEQNALRALEDDLENLLRSGTCECV
jgi:hypothetical protein